MKKYILLSLVLCGLLLFGCAPKHAVSNLELIVTDGVVAGDSASERSVVLFPNYEKRELKVVYSMKDASGKPGATSEGIVGGDYFDRFDLLVEYVYSGDLDEFGIDKFSGSEIGVLTIKSVGVDGSNKVFKLAFDDGENFVENFRSFYLDLVNLLTENEAV